MMVALIELMASVTSSIALALALGISVALLVRSQRNLSRLVRSESDLKLARFSIDRSGLAIFWLARDATIRHVNQVACRWLGYSEKELLGKRVWEIDETMKPNDWPRHWDEVRAMGSFTLESIHRSKDGRRIPVSVTVNFLAFEDEEFNCAVVQDITERRNREIALKDSEARKSGMLQAALDGIVTIDLEGKVIDFNPAAETIFGFKRPEVIDREMVDLLVPRPLREAHRQGMVKYRNTGIGDILGKRIEVDALHADGAVFPVELAVTPIELAEGTLFTAYIRDITDRKKSEAELEEARINAERASAYKTRFLANMSHEIRTPLTAITGYSHLLVREGQVHSESSEWAQQIQRNAHHLLSLVDNILDLSKIEAGEVVVSLRPVSLVRVISDSMTLLSRPAKEKSLDLEVSYSTPVPELILTDPVRLRQILINLAGNGIKFTDQGGVRIFVSYHPDPKASAAGSLECGLVRITVSDDGIGIPEKDFSRIFESFTQLDPEDIRGGTGLGLGLSRRLARMLGGELGVSSNVGEGSDFTLELKVEVPEGGRLVTIDELTKCVAAHGGPAAPSDDLQGVKILVADDTRDNQRIVGFLLQTAGAQVDDAENGAEAVRMAVAAASTTQPYDLILMDMKMPVMDGYEATRELRRSGVKSPVVALTAHAMTGDREKCGAAGCDDYLSKPVNPGTFVGDLRRILEGRSQARAEPTEAPPDGFGEVLRNYLAGVPATIGTLRDAVIAQDRSEVAAIVHRVKGSAGSYGFGEVSELAQTCLLELRGAEEVNLDRLITPLLESLQKIATSSSTSSASADETP